MIGNEIVDRITKVSKAPSQNNLEIEFSLELKVKMIKKIPKKRYISPEERQKIIDDMRLI